MRPAWSIAKKELASYFGSPMAAIFIAAFLLASLFSFFWVETFFARNIADIRPLFRWMPLLLIFLSAALTMRQWSEEQKMGTLEVLLTLPVRLSDLVLGKFLAVLCLVGLALALTFCLPLSVSFMGDIDWGPVLGGYLGGLLMAAAYIAIGLFISSRTDNQIVALLLTVLACGLFYLVGSPAVTGFFGNQAGELLRKLGSGSRFASIERGVVDLRDLAYYLSLTVLFLALNVYALAGKRWSRGAASRNLRRSQSLALVLLAANLLALNVWLQPLAGLRLDLTEDHEFSLSATSRDLLQSLQEPLILRGYFSAKTHPLLAPLVPRIRDFLQEYAQAGHGQVRVSFVDPRQDPEAEAEANQQYGIKPVPFQVAGRYEASVVNSYFNILVKYGDQYVTLGFNDLIEVTPRPDGELEVGLRNLEYDLTKSIKKVVYGFQGLDTILARRDKPLTLTAIITPATLPKAFAKLPAAIRTAARELEKEADGKLRFQEINPDAPGAAMDRKTIAQRFGAKPLRASLLADTSFYLQLFLENGNTSEPIVLRGDMTSSEIRREVEATIKRTSAGFLKTVGLWLPKPGRGERPRYQLFQQALRENYNLSKVDLASGQVPGEIDVLLLVAPQEMSDLERLAVDQYLMRGGSVVVLAGRYVLDLPPGAQTLGLRQIDGGIGKLLAHYGIKVDKALVMDQQNEPFPVPVTRDLGGVLVQEIKHINYPFFVDVRADGMDRQSPVTARLPAVTMNWSSPLELDQKKLAGRTVTRLLTSSSHSWLRYEADIEPDFERYPDYGFPVGEQQKPRLLAVAVTGSFASFFKDRPDPRLAADQSGKLDKKGRARSEKAAKKSRPAVLTPLLGSSSSPARLAVVGSSEFVSDVVISVLQSLGQDRYLNNLDFLQNLIDWSVEDQDLLAIRSRGSQARLLYPMSRREEVFWEWLNYGAALAGLLLVSLLGYRRLRRQTPLRLEPPSSGEKRP